MNKTQFTAPKPDIKTPTRPPRYRPVQMSRSRVQEVRGAVCNPSHLSHRVYLYQGKNSLAGRMLMRDLDDWKKCDSDSYSPSD
ncbi:hypothetical protein E2C01_085358 [Portunus trituberculatus]|uniref:Uncharacterized protein n=1 Tax=Portunus trituberculatus TaxID=210409 RepID=A0A5B7JA95_PORTR|nr:hypothetical protein [Portunus trituberculatus]